MLRVGITRTSEQLRELTEEGKRRGVEVIPLPFTRIEFIDFELPRDVALGEEDWLFFTSANGVDAFVKGFERQQEKLPDSCRIAAVGRKTEQAVKRAGWKVDFLPDEAYGEALFREFVNEYRQIAGKALYARAEDVQLDPAKLFDEAGIEYFPLVCYRSVASQADLAVVTELREDDAILFTAPSAVRVYEDKYGQPIARPIAIGRTTAAEMDRFGWGKVSILPEPDIDKVMEFV